MAVLVCVCGAPAEPVLGGIRGGHTPNVEMARFFEGFKRLAHFVEHQTAETVGDFAAAGRFAPADALNQIPEKLQSLEKAIGRVLAARDPRRKTLVGRHWKPPKRQPEAKSGRAWLAVELQKRGFAFRQARAAVKAIFDVMAEALRLGDDVETPLGTFEVVYAPREQTREHWGKTQTLFRNYKRVRFRPDAGWKRVLAPPGQKKHAPDPQEEKREKKAGLLMSSLPEGALLKCPHCKGTSFTEQEFRQYRAALYSSIPGGDISPASKDADVIQALVCLCGHVLPPPKKGSQNRDAYKSFVSCCAAALAYRDSLAEQLLAALRGRFASAERLQLFIDRLDADGEIVKLLKTK
jgi:nucleoid DNA-binding protein